MRHIDNASRKFYKKFRASSNVELTLDEYKQELIDLINHVRTLGPKFKDLTDREIIILLQLKDKGGDKK